MVSIITKSPFQLGQEVIHRHTKDIGKVESIVDKYSVSVRYPGYHLPIIQANSVIRHTNLFPCS